MRRRAAPLVLSIAALLSAPLAAAAQEADVCPRCRAKQLVPLERRAPYVHLERQPHPGVEMVVPWQYCPACQADRPAEQLLPDVKKRLAAAEARHKLWEKQLGSDLTRIHTRHALLLVDLPPSAARKCGEAIEALAGHLQKLTGSIDLTPTQPDECEILIASATPGYRRLLAAARASDEFKGVKDWDLAAQTAGFSTSRTALSDARGGQGPPPHHLALAHFSGAQIARATAGHPPDWLLTGFPYYCEHALTKLNLVHSIRYQLPDLDLTGNWNVAVLQAARAGKLRPLADFVGRDLANYDAADHLAAYSFVAFLIESDPARFLKLVDHYRQNRPAEVALTEVYGTTLPELQAAWGKWALRRR